MASSTTLPSEKKASVAGYQVAEFAPCLRVTHDVKTSNSCAALSRQPQSLRDSTSYSVSAETTLSGFILSSLSLGSGENLVVWPRAIAMGTVQNDLALLYKSLYSRHNSLSKLGLCSGWCCPQETSSLSWQQNACGFIQAAFRHARIYLHHRMTIVWDQAHVLLTFNNRELAPTPVRCVILVSHPICCPARRL